MEPEDGSAEVEWEAKRVATAMSTNEFRLTRYEYAHVSPFKHVSYCATHARYRSIWGQTKIGWTMVAQGTSLQDVRLVVLQDFQLGECLVYRRAIDSTQPKLGGPWAVFESSTCNPTVILKEDMARTLYRLGIDIENEEWLVPLNVHLSTHEKLDLRLSMPREFWPKKWLEEENATK
ncbi:hypothetical protein IAD21_00280 [Abditibacteriota bacterium]|nr:hypothetical protein IAD21_00280 [Abditibacteriota bacterium]